MLPSLFRIVVAFAGLINVGGCAALPADVNAARAALAADFEGLIVVERGSD